ncbi:MAG: type II secretion system protein [Proteobacteria bacterium]|nr:type II secretion system protein [Pseudomonadota bacterium]
MNGRGFTLIETMICVALMGITAALAGVTGAQMRMNAQVEIQQAQAQLVLDSHASAASRGVAVAPEATARVLAPLPDGVVTWARAGSARTLTVAWRDPHGRAVTRSLTVFAKPGAP